MGKDVVVNLRDHKNMMEAMKKLYGRSEHDEKKDSTNGEPRAEGSGQVVDINAPRHGRGPHKAK